MRSARVTVDDDTRQWELVAQHFHHAIPRLVVDDDDLTIDRVGIGVYE